MALAKKCTFANFYENIKAGHCDRLSTKFDEFLADRPQAIQHDMVNLPTMRISGCPEPQDSLRYIPQIPPTQGLRYIPRIPPVMMYSHWQDVKTQSYTIDLPHFQVFLCTRTHQNHERGFVVPKFKLSRDSQITLMIYVTYISRVC